MPIQETQETLAAALAGAPYAISPITVTTITVTVHLIRLR